ncbi:MFS transporter [Mucilaginibacter lappiensis]|uniref:MFS family permease n=1 Tax=Mucilaginibacter lappiensis TaxID=354630 RepID=A0A1N6VLC3_9SPHI|nr:MFS transporter [Mucilaginibacter lappiensis]MBB6109173.1 MFS family permease [Mucilaginibacter lappiensis]MBB6127233.1 MFS family permease [Mucilaginibacter lappiensis]SIQ78589.1 Predicted arabinose efflux permease, MFS family [Mucilaginibacter lappiensis]
MNISTFNAFKSRNYRLYFAGQSISLVGTWMQKTAVSWVIYSLTHSEFMLGLTLFASLFPSFLFSFLGGVTADRYNRYRLLLATQAASMIQALLLTALIFWGHYVVWEIIALSAVLGLINAFDVPARQSLVYEMVDNKADLPNALALNSSMVNLSRLIGPGIAGLVLEKFGDTVCFGANAISFIAVIGSLLMMRLPKMESKKHDKNIFSELKEGFVYISNTPSIKSILIMLAAISLLVLPFSTLIPVYAKDIFKGTASTFGVLDSLIGLGAFSGAIYLASLKPGHNLKKILAVNTLIFGAGLVIFSHMPSYPLALLFAAVTGFGMMSQITISNTLIQTTVAPDMRGRVISFYAMAFFGMQPLGGLLVGSVSQWIGTADTVMLEGIVALIIGLLHFRFLRKTQLQKDTVHTLEQQPINTLS